MARGCEEPAPGSGPGRRDSQTVSVTLGYSLPCSLPHGPTYTCCQRNPAPSQGREACSPSLSTVRTWVVRHPRPDCRRKQSPGRPSTQHAWVVLMVSRAPCRPPQPQVSWTILPSGSKQAPGPTCTLSGAHSRWSPHLPPQPPRAQAVGRAHQDRREVLMDASPQRGWEPLAGRTKGTSPVTPKPGTMPVLRQESVREPRAPRDVC